jgi:hypothetical protein
MTEDVNCRYYNEGNCESMSCPWPGCGFRERPSDCPWYRRKLIRMGVKPPKHNGKR